ncbi:hypothetical protein [Pseudonocardia adelaidensis]|uniref:Ribbon-helix-helix CopG family protein n=1 Tax=Pseudonocardia adelaidensis TaxID=648754 RepID=A0ABP9NVJ4_9PSEU
MTEPRRDLSALRAGLGGIRDLRQQPPAPQLDDQHPVGRATGEARPQRQGRKPAKPAAPAAGKKLIPVYLAATTKTRLEHLARTGDVTLTEWVLDRLDEYYDDLGDVFRPAPRRRSPLPPRQRTIRQRTEASSIVQLRLTGAELAAIEKLREQLEVPSRSALLARVIELGIERAERGHGD